MLQTELAASANPKGRSSDGTPRRPRRASACASHRGGRLQAARTGTLFVRCRSSPPQRHGQARSRIRSAHGQQQERQPESRPATRPGRSSPSPYSNLRRLWVVDTWGVGTWSRGSPRLQNTEGHDTERPRQDCPSARAHEKRGNARSPGPAVPHEGQPLGARPDEELKGEHEREADVDPEPGATLRDADTAPDDR